jgi:hypothetical protein
MSAKAFDMAVAHWVTVVLSIAPTRATLPAAMSSEAVMVVPPTRARGGARRRDVRGAARRVAASSDKPSAATATSVQTAASHGTGRPRAAFFSYGRNCQRCARPYALSSKSKQPVSSSSSTSNLSSLHMCVPDENATLIFWLL